MTDHALTHLHGGAARLGALAARPQFVAALCVIVLSALGWAAIGIGVASENLWMAICSPAATFPSLALTAGMWLAMTLAMMLPGAAPMILTYAQIADTAARKGERIVSPLMIAAGYCAVWIGFALVAALLQTQFSRIELPASTLTKLSAAGFIAAGLYQFTALKHACLEKCRNPLMFFFTNWQTTPRGVLRLGVKQGLACLGCCWAMMALMFVTGTMNVIWMAALAVFMTIEKMSRSRLPSILGGVALIGIGLFVLTTG